MEEINSLIHVSDAYYQQISIEDKLKLASLTNISSIKNKNYKSFDDLRQNIILFPPDSTIIISDYDLLVMIMNRCRLTYSYPIVQTNFDIVNLDEFTKFSEFITKIDNFVNSFSYDEIIKKPEFIMDLNDKNIQDYINGKVPLIRFSNNKNDNNNKNLLSFDKSIMSDIQNVGNDLDEFSQKKKFYDCNTDFISRIEIFADFKQKLIFKFQYIVNNFFNNFNKLYIEKNNLNSDDIYFIFKGGTFMKIIFEKYDALLENNTNFNNFNKNYFKRSDSDYALLINGKFDKKTYTTHYYWLNIATYNILNKIKFFINENLNDILPINEISDNKIVEQLEKINDILINDRINLSYFKDVDKFIGMSIYDKTVMTEDIPDNFNLYVLEPTSLTSQDDYIIKVKKPKKKSLSKITQKISKKEYM